MKETDQKKNIASAGDAVPGKEQGAGRKKRATGGAASADREEAVAAPASDEDNEDGGDETIREAAKATKKASAKYRWQPGISYQWIMKNISFFLFLAALAVIYIYNGHYADKIVRDINRTNKELKELQYEYKTLKSEVMFRSKQSELARDLERSGLKELVQPPVVLIDSATVKR